MADIIRKTAAVTAGSVLGQEWVGSEKFYDTVLTTMSLLGSLQRPQHKMLPEKLEIWKRL